MNIRYILSDIVSVVALLLGGLWLLQGLDLVRIQPIACVAECETITGGSPLWAVVGGIVFIAGVIGLWLSVQRIRRRERK